MAADWEGRMMWEGGTASFKGVWESPPCRKPSSVLETEITDPYIKPVCLVPVTKPMYFVN